jgi:hypothetical protein
VKLKMANSCSSCLLQHDQQVQACKFGYLEVEEKIVSSETTIGGKNVFEQGDILLFMKCAKLKAMHCLLLKVLSA